jgi:hypothetical protein
MYGGNGKKKEFREKESLLRKNQEARLSTKAKMEKRQQQAQQCLREIFFISKINIVIMYYKWMIVSIINYGKIR